MRGLEGKVAIVAGAAPGSIGGATAVRLAQEGMKVVAADLNETGAQAVVDEIKAVGGVLRPEHSTSAWRLHTRR
jgi:NAD(P)-dependent dehydrogenase (short-subunit alcohol dehydrogenase family)